MVGTHIINPTIEATKVAASIAETGWSGRRTLIIIRLRTQEPLAAKPAGEAGDFAILILEEAV